MSSGRKTSMQVCTATVSPAELVKLVEEELENRTDYDVVFFNAGHYSDYGVPMFQVGNHYFSSYD